MPPSTAGSTFVLRAMCLPVTFSSFSCRQAVRFPRFSAVCLPPWVISRPSQTKWASCRSASPPQKDVYKRQDYKDAAEKIETCHYELGMKALEADNLKLSLIHIWWTLHGTARRFAARPGRTLYIDFSVQKTAQNLSLIHILACFERSSYTMRTSLP